MTVGDWIADPSGLHLADFELLTRMAGVEAIEVVATAGLLESGFHQRIHDWLPGIDEVEVADLNLAAPPIRRPSLTVPVSETDSLTFVYRDREEELIAVARRLQTDAGVPGAAAWAGVDWRSTRLARSRRRRLQRPLPYLYLVREVFRSAGLPYQTFDAMPLAAEPFAAALILSSSSSNHVLREGR